MDENLGIVVGIDGSEGSARALRWAAAESEHHQLPLLVVHIWSRWQSPVPPPHPVVDAPSRRADELLENATGLLRTPHRRAPLEVRAVQGHAVPDLLRFSECAELIVVGSHGEHGFAGLPIGSVAHRVVKDSACPAVVVRPRVSPHGAPIVLGVDGSEANQAAVAFAFHEASTHGVPLEAMLCWHADSGLPRYAQAEALLGESLVPWREKHPEVRVLARVLLRCARPALIGASRNASLLVVGSRGYGAMRSRFLGSVSSALIQQADCPVAVVRS